MITTLHRGAVLFVLMALLTPAAQAKAHHRRKVRVHSIAQLAGMRKAHKHSHGAKHKQLAAKPASVRPSPMATRREEERLSSLSRRIDRDTAHMDMDNHVEMIATQFHAPLSTVEELHRNGHSWGDVSISLAMADALRRKDHVHFATTANALNRILDVRDKAHSWGVVATRLGIPLTSVVAATEQSYTDANTVVASAN